MSEAVSSQVQQLPLSLTLVRATMKVLSRTTPDLASKIAETMFMTPRRFKAPAREREMLATARPVSIPFQERPLQAWIWGEGPAIVLAHGWEGRGSQLTPFVPALVASGHSVVAFDAPGHGLTGGRRSSLPHFALALRAVCETAGEVAGVIAHSFGCASTTLAMSDGLVVPRAVFISPPLDPGEYPQRFGDIVGLNDRVVQQLKARIEKRFLRKWTDYSLQRLARSMTAPLLVIHDRNDNETLWEEGAALAAAWPGAGFMSTEGLGHRRILRDPEVVRRTAAFFAAADQR